MYLATFPVRCGPIELTGPLGSGGMARVYEGFRVGAGGVRTRVAVKCLHSERAWDDKAVAMFIDEARLNAQLTHPNIIAVHDFFTHDGLHFIVMERVDGCDLAVLLELIAERGQPMPLEVAVEILRQLLTGLDYAHRARDAQGVPLQLIHRDLKPANIFLTRHGGVKLGDFGIAKTRLSTLSTTTGGFRGTPFYFSPEQFRGEPLSAASDLFAVGLILYEMLAGRRLFRQDSLAELAGAMLRFEVGPVLEALPEAGTPLRGFLERALAPSRADRYPSAADALADLLEIAPVPLPSQRLEAWLEPMLPEIAARRARLASIQSTRPGRTAALADPSGTAEAGGEGSDRIDHTTEPPSMPSAHTALPAAAASPPTTSPGGAAGSSRGTHRGSRFSRLPTLLGSAALLVLGAAAGGGLKDLQRAEQTAALESEAGTTGSQTHASAGQTAAPEGQMRTRPMLPPPPSGSPREQAELEGGRPTPRPEAPSSRHARPAPASTAVSRSPASTELRRSLASAELSRPPASAEVNRPPASTEMSRPTATPPGHPPATPRPEPSRVPLVLSMLPNDQTVSIDGGPRLPVPWTGQVAAGRHQVTFHCEDYEHTVTLELREGGPERLVWNCPEAAPFRPGGPAGSQPGERQD